MKISSSLSFIATALLFSAPTFAADHTYNFNCAPIPSDGRDRRTVTLPAGDTATINVDISTANKCDWAYTSGNVSPLASGGAAQAVYTIGATGSGDVNVYKAGVGGYVWTFQHQSAPLPTIAGISPSTGPAAGGTSISISGTNLTGTTSVKFGGVDAQSFTVDSPTQITAITPAGVAGEANITVTTPSGASAPVVAGRFLYVVRQTDSISTVSGGGTVTAQIKNGSAGCSIDLPNTASYVPPAYNGVTPPLGGVKIKVGGCNVGETIQLSVTFSNLNGMIARKYGVTPTSGGKPVWYIPAGLSINGNTITYNVTDNGLGDDTFTGADGIINDPIIPLPAAALENPSIPTLTEYALFALSGVLGLLGWLHMRGSRRKSGAISQKTIA